MLSITKWVVASFAVFGAALAAGVQLTDLSTIQGTAERLIALAAALAVLLGVVGIIASATRVLGFRFPPGRLAGVTTSGEDESRRELRERKELGEVVKWLDKDPTLFVAQADDCVGLVRKYKQCLDKGEGGDLAARKKAFALDRILRQVARYAQYELVRRRFLSARRTLMVLGTVIGLGIIAFAWAASTRTLEGQSIVQTPGVTPYAAEVLLTPEGISALTRDLGEDCATSGLSAIVLGTDNVSYDLLILESPECPHARLNLSQSLGMVVRR